MRQNLPEGSTLQYGRYEIVKILGQGGFGITYEAMHTGFRRRMCVKEFFPKDYCDRDGTGYTMTVGTQGNVDLVDRLKSKFLKEAATLDSLNHPGIVRVKDYFEENGTAYYVMDLIEGESLQSIVGRKGPLSSGEAVGYVLQVSEALSYIHSSHITHLDVKPANIMVRRRDNLAVLIDFGISKHYGDDGVASTLSPVARSAGYAAQEQYDGVCNREFSPKTDVYALGGTLYYLLTGARPPLPSEIMNYGLSFPDRVPEYLQVAIRKAMEVGVVRRSTLSEFVGQLKGVTASDENTKFDDDTSDDTTPDNAAVGRNNREENVSRPTTPFNPTPPPPSSKPAKPSNPVSPEEREEPKPGRRYLWIVMAILFAMISGIAVYIFDKPSSSEEKTDATEAVAPDNEAPTLEDLSVAEGEELAPSEEEAAAPAEEASPAEAEAAAPAEAEAQPEPSVPRQTTGMINGHEWVDLGLSVKWGTCNVGASSPSGYGNYYAWGETTTKSEYTSDNCSTYDKNIGDISGNTRYDAARANWGSPWRMPTKKEFEELINRCTWTWTTQGGHSGYKVTGPNGNTLFLPAAGWRRGSSLRDAGERGYYWSSTPYGGGTQGAYGLYFYGGGRLADWLYRYRGQSVRPVSD